MVGFRFSTIEPDRANRIFPLIMSIDFQKANQYLPHIILIGVGIGTANFFLNGELNWLQWVVQAICTSLIIGYSLVVIAANRATMEETIQPNWKLYAVLIVVFFLLGSIASEVEHFIRSTIFGQNPYTPFSGGRSYLFNGIISNVLGFSFFQNSSLFPKTNPSSESKEEAIEESSPQTITKVPVKQGESFLLIPLEEIAYFEAFDNYSFVFNLKGEKRLCDYSLLFLEQRLAGSFLRVHRKYIVNTNHIQELRPHLNGRYVISFSNTKLPSITSSKSYSTAVRKLFKIN